VRGETLFLSLMTGEDEAEAWFEDCMSMYETDSSLLRGGTAYPLGFPARWSGGHQTGLALRQ